MQAAIYGLEGTELTADERAFFADVDPAGYILFARNCAAKSATFPPFCCKTAVYSLR